MKGLKHNVIEINDTQNDNIDRILVFLKPQASDVAVMTSRAEAEKILQDLDVKKVGLTRRRKLVWLSAAICLAALAAALILFV